LGPVIPNILGIQTMQRIDVVLHACTPAYLRTATFWRLRASGQAGLRICVYWKCLEIDGVRGPGALSDSMACAGEITGMPYRDDWCFKPQLPELV